MVLKYVDRILILFGMPLTINPSIKAISILFEKYNEDFFIKRLKYKNNSSNLYFDFIATTDFSNKKNFKNLNQNSIGIEISNPGHSYIYKKFSKKQIQSLIKLSKLLIKKYKINFELDDQGAKVMITEAKAAYFKNKIVWPMKIAFYKENSKSENPDYEISLELDEFGVVHSYNVNYGNFKIKAVLKNFNIMKKKKCK